MSEAKKYGDELGTFAPERLEAAVAQLYLEYEHEPEAFAAFLDLIQAHGGDLARLTATTHEPVPIDEFLADEYFMGKVLEQIWPVVFDSVRNVISGGYVEAMYMGAIGIAKCLGKDTPVLMHDGTTKPVQEVAVGDLLMGPDSHPRRVTSLAQGREPLYRIHQKGGEPYVVNQSHILSLRYTDTTSRKRNGNVGYRHGAMAGDVRNLSVTEWQALSPSHRALLKGWKPDSVEFAAANDPREPYFIGLWLGDGNQDAPTIYTMDDEVVDYLEDLAARNGVKLVAFTDPRGNQAKTYRLGRRSPAHPNPVRSLLRHYKLLGHKHIPQAYKTASRDARLQLLAGLLDSDGSLAQGKSTFVIVQKRERLIQDIAFVARSLGFRATIKEAPCNGTMYYRLFISGATHEIPTRIARKRAAVRQQVKEINRWGVKAEPIGEGDYYGFTVDGPDRLFLLGDFTVTHNTTQATIVNAYGLYEVSTELFPQYRYGLLPTTDITFAMLNKTDTLAKDVTYARFKSLIESIPYFNDHFRHNPGKESRMDFRDNISVIYAPAYSDNLLGMNVMSGIIDEINFMSITEKSKRTHDGGTFDQAESIYTGMVRRRKSRFESAGRCPGCLCVVSSKGYAGDFTERRKAEVEAENDGLTYIFDHAQWDVLPPVRPTGERRWCGEKFLLEVGDERHNMRILDDMDEARDGAEVLEVPVEFKTDFRKDPEGSLRDFAGRSSYSMRPYFSDREKVWSMATRFDREGATPVFQIDITDLANGQLPEVLKGYKPKNPNVPRAVHIDLALSGDWCGLAVGHINRVQTSRVMDHNTGDDRLEEAPHVLYDCILAIKPPPGGEIEFAMVRQVIYLLRDVARLPIRWVSFDGFQSVDSRQILRKKGFRTSHVSVEGEEAYQAMRTACYQERLAAPEHQLAFEELTTLERNPKDGRVDHPAHGSKDTADAMCGVYVNLLKRRSAWRDPSHYGDAPAVPVETLFNDEDGDPDEQFETPEPEPEELKSRIIRGRVRRNARRR